MFLQMLFSVLFNQKLMKTFRWWKFQIEKTKQTLLNDNKNSTKNKWIALNWECVEIVEMTLTMLKLFDRNDDSLVALKTKLNKIVFFFKVVFMTTINMLSFINNVDFIKSKNNQLIKHRQSKIWKIKKKSKQIDSYLVHIDVSNNNRF